ncbi:cytochrome P450 [bacterium]|nr:cytochrome P450 [bacterium]
MKTAAQSLVQIPLARGLPVLGNALELANDVAGYLTAQYKQLGPVFRVRALQREMVVLAGVEANLFYAQEGKNLFRSRDFWQEQDEEFGAKRSLISMDGEDHVRLRKVQRPGYARSALLENLPTAISIITQEIAGWPLSQPLPALYSIQRIVTEQLSVIAANHSAKEDLDTIITAVRTILATRVTKQHPGVLRRLPGFRKAKARFMEIGGEVIASHSPSLREGKQPDLVDALLALHREDPDFLPASDMMTAVLGPFIAGLDTVASTTAFILYALLKYPDLAQQVTVEADELFANGLPDAAALRKMDVTHRVALEAMRLWSIAPALTRTTTQEVHFAGYTIPANTDVIIATTVPHHLAEYFPDPEQFDIERYSAERNEHRQPDAYAPFGLGPHTCLGQGLAEIQMTLVIATLFHFAELRLSPANYELGFDPVPTLSPDKNMRFTVTRLRHPIQS